MTPTSSSANSFSPMLIDSGTSHFTGDRISLRDATRKLGNLASPIAIKFTASNHLYRPIDKENTLVQFAFSHFRSINSGTNFKDRCFIKAKRIAKRSSQESKR